MLLVLSEKVATESERRRPDHAARCIVNREINGPETVDSCEKRRIDAQKRDEPSEKHDHAAKSREEVFSQRQLLPIDSDAMPIFHQQRSAETTSDPKTYV